MTEHSKAVKAMIWGVVASFFLSSTFIINSLLAGSGGYWAWTAALRSLFLIPILGLVVFFAKQLQPLLTAIRQYPFIFIKWGTIGFGVLYTLLAVASLWSPGWMVAATFQINILAGMLLAPFIYPDHRRHIPRKALLLSVFIIFGVFVMQFDKMGELNSAGSVLLSFFIVLLGAVVWPLGNRKLLVDLEQKGLHLNALQRVLGMSIGCLPLLILISVIGFANAGLPSLTQCQASFYSALFSGFLGGVSFYQATQIVNKNPVALATIEATQVFEILFTLLGEMVLKGTPFPGFYGQMGLFIVLSGMVFHFWNTLNHSRNLSMRPLNVVN
ncbi:multidrug resistance efflux transporter family protein [Xanthocytophaga agilis]|uniref:Multidrug resistance efflux transporter family protein n=1 Tax=Xanthocytophaga agilis TaxID=3048010 RepID=A0AAE3R2T5_9BACT|nr:multidrug resistance efflux transporter family protein [Xanthocytophaga agilis]MDJ1502796.1 multidrug resistance efflux transporter family protein [Xanthocytophaga agilis]